MNEWMNKKCMRTNVFPHGFMFNVNGCKCFLSSTFIETLMSILLLYECEVEKVSSTF